MLRTACDMLDKVYKEQYEKVTNYINEMVEERAHKGMFECDIHPAQWGNECPLISAEAVVDELNLKGYTATLKDYKIEISWKGAELLCMDRPSKILPETTVREA